MDTGTSPARNTSGADRRYGWRRCPARPTPFASGLPPRGHCSARSPWNEYAWQILTRELGQKRGFGKQFGRSRLAPTWPAAVLPWAEELARKGLKPFGEALVREVVRQ